MGKPNPHNLITMNQRTEEEQRKLAVMGGKASGIARTRKRDYAYTISLALSILEEKALKDIIDPIQKQLLEDCGIEVMTLIDIMKNKNLRPADRLKALDMIMDRTAGKPTQKQEITGANGTALEITQISQEEVMKRAQELLSDNDIKRK